MIRRLCIVSLLGGAALLAPASLPQTASQLNAPVVNKVEPPNWWIHLTPELMLLLSGRNLQATEVACNLPQIVVQRTESTHGGDYLFVWLKFGVNLQSGTAVCRITTPQGQTSFELPLSPREATLHRFQGLAQTDVLYLIMPDRFADGDLANDEPREFPGSHDRAKPHAWHGGDLRGIQDHLDYLKDLGVTALWLTPIVKNGAAQDYHGYGAVDLYSVDPHLGSLADYQNLVAAAHKSKIKIFFDAVPNHVGPLHPWVRKPPLPDWFHGTPEHHLDSYSPVKPAFYGIERRETIGNDPFEALVDPHAPESMKRNTTDGWFFGVLPDLNTENPVVAQYLLQNSIWWTESSGLDGFRVDTFPYVPRRFWAQWHAGLRRIYPKLTTIGEVFHADPVVTSFFAGGEKRWDGIDSGLSTVFDFPMFFALRDILLHGAPAGRIAGVLEHDALYPHPGDLVTFFANHDVERFASAEGSSPQKLMLAFGLLATLRGIPELYYGDEIAMPGGNDPDNRRDFPGGWPDDPKNAFLESGRTPQQQEVLATVRTLLALRSEHPALSSGRLWHLFSDARSYVFLRETGQERLLVVFSSAATPRDLTVPDTDTPVHGAVRFTLLYGPARVQGSPDALSIAAPPQSLSIFYVD